MLGTVTSPACLYVIILAMRVIRPMKAERDDMMPFHSRICRGEEEYPVGTAPGACPAPGAVVARLCRRMWLFLFNGVLFLLFCLSLLPAQQAFAYSAGGRSSPPALQVSLGFQATYRLGFWTPVFVTASNASQAGFSGTLSVSTYAGSPRTSNNASAYWTYEEPVSLRPGEQKRYTLNVPFYFGV